VLTASRQVPGNIDVDSQSGRGFFTFHPAGSPDPALGQAQTASLVPPHHSPHSTEVVFDAVPRGAAVQIQELTTEKPGFKPFPSLELQKALVTVLSVRCDQQGHLWALDWGNHGEKTPALVAYNLGAEGKSGVDAVSAGSLHRRFEFPPEVAGKGSMLNDMVTPGPPRSHLSRRGGR
jgi:hypothetical protein